MSIIGIFKGGPKHSEISELNVPESVEDVIPTSLFYDTIADNFDSNDPIGMLTHVRHEYHLACVQAVYEYVGEKKS